MSQLLMRFSKRDGHNMSYSYGTQFDVYLNRFNFSFNNNFSFFSNSSGNLIPHGFAPLFLHGATILTITEKNRKDFDGVGIMKKSTVDCDAVITNCARFPVLMPNADCYPVVLFDPTENIFSVIHGGRSSVLLGIVKKTAKEMGEHFGCRVENIIAYIFPGICVRCYEHESLTDPIPQDLADCVSETGSGTFRFDLRRMILRQLNREGIRYVLFPEGKYECTCCTPGPDSRPKYYSHYGHKKHFPGHEKQGNNALFVEMK